MAIQKTTGWLVTPKGKGWIGSNPDPKMVVSHSGYGHGSITFSMASSNCALELQLVTCFTGFFTGCDVWWFQMKYLRGFSQGSPVNHYPSIFFGLVASGTNVTQLHGFPWFLWDPTPNKSNNFGSFESATGPSNFPRGEVGVEVWAAWIQTQDFGSYKNDLHWRLWSCWDAKETMFFGLMSASSRCPARCDYMYIFVLHLYLRMYIYMYIYCIYSIFALLRTMASAIPSGVMGALLRLASVLVMTQASTIEAWVGQSWDINSATNPTLHSQHDLLSYCWWTKSCTTKDDDYPIIFRVLTISGGAGFCPSTLGSAVSGTLFALACS